MYDQSNIFDITLPDFKIDKPIRLIELFAGIGSQAMALRDLETNFEHYRAVEFDRFAIKSYNAIHGTNFRTSDITKLSGRNLERIYILRGLGYWPYVMIYDKQHTKQTDTVRKIQRWVNARAVFETVRRFEDYQKKEGGRI